MKIYIPHIAYTVYIQDIKKSKLLEGATAQTECIDHSTSIISIKLPIRQQDVPSLNHELMHVMRNICVGRLMDIEKENEHLAYIMQYITGKILGLLYIPRK